MYLPLGHSHIIIYTKRTSFDPPIQWGAFTKSTSFFTERPVIFITCHSKISFCVKTPKIFIYMSPKDPIFFENSLFFVIKKPSFFELNFITERPLHFKCAIHMYVSLYKSSATGISPHPFSPSQHLSLPLSIM